MIDEAIINNLTSSLLLPTMFFMMQKWGLLCGIVQPSYETLAWNTTTKFTYNNHKCEKLFVENKIM